MRFELAEEHRLFAESVRSAIGAWEPLREPELGTWLDDRDDALAGRLAAAGWAELWTDPGLLGAVVAGGLELGRAIAPACLLDEAMLGGALTVSDRARHGERANALAVPVAGGGLALGRPSDEPVAEATLDGSGTVRLRVEIVEELTPVEAAARWCAWSAATLAYFGGLAGQALALSVGHARTREQFGAPLAALPAVQARLAEAALRVDGITLLAWASTEGEGGLREPELRWAGAACSAVTASAHQVHGATGFALETGLHRLHRRAKAMQSWAAAICVASR
jgi:acyl-CoA dehydrogenase-like protein